MNETTGVTKDTLIDWNGMFGDFIPPLKQAYYGTLFLGAD